MKILIIGSEGFIGNHLVKLYTLKGTQLTGCDLYEAPRNSNYKYIKVSRLSPQWEKYFPEWNLMFVSMHPEVATFPIQWSIPFLILKLTLSM